MVDVSEWPMVCGDGTPLADGTHPLGLDGDQFRSGVRYRLMEATAEAICTAVVDQVYQEVFSSNAERPAVNTFRACHYLRAMAIWGI